MLVNELPTEGTDRTRAFWARFLSVAEQSDGLLEAIACVLAPDVRIHFQNGEVGDAAIADQHTALSALMFPDLVVEVDDVFFPDDRLVIQLRMSGSATGPIPFVEPGRRFTTLGCVVARVNESLQLQEVWNYLNPGFAYSYPPSGVAKPDPPSDGAGTAEARALYQTWVRRAEAGEDFVTAVASTVAVDGAVHIGNGDVAGPQLLRDLFASIVIGLPDLSLVIDDVILHDDRVVVQFSTSGTHRGQLGVYGPTGVTVPGRGCLIVAANRKGEAARLWIYMAPGYALTLPPTGGLR
jgi:hypothetical protein